LSIYDDFGRRKEDRMINLNGEIFQQVIYEYDANGKPKKPKVINVASAAAPTIKPGTVDFTKSVPGGPTSAPSTDRFAPTQAPATGPIYAPGAEPAGAAPAEEKPKPGFFKRLFGGKDKK
jgi:hypothetical protein